MSLRNLIGAAMFLPTAFNKDQRGRKMNRIFHNMTPEGAKFYWNKSESTTRHMAKFLSPITAVNKRVRVRGIPINMGDGVVSACILNRHVLRYSFVSMLLLDGVVFLLCICGFGCAVLGCAVLCNRAVCYAMLGFAC
jgi:hypothetical protein